MTHGEHASSDSWGYRLRQLGLALWGTPGRDDLAAAERILSPAEYSLFLNLQSSEQAHALNILRALQAQGEAERILLAAALLHDVGKAAQRLSLIGRIAVVLGQQVLPEKVKTWGIGQPSGWKRPFVIAAQHPAWGAEMAARAGSPAEVVALIAAHQEPAPAGMNEAMRKRLLALQAVDNQH
jgi:putative nucleotidyltransferase with HDIG domain